MERLDYDDMLRELDTVTKDVGAKYPGYIIDYNVDIATLQKYVAVTYLMPDGKDYRRCTAAFRPCTPVTYDDVVYLVEMVKEAVNEKNTSN